MILSQLNVAEAAEICLRFRHDRNSDECICTYLGDAAEIEAAKHYPETPQVVLPVGYIETNTRKKWKW
jgi:hypothetical protein